MFNDKKQKDIHKCMGCGLKDKKVEACGLFYCPNPECRGAGAAWFRVKLKTYQDKGDYHTVCPVELKYAAGLYKEAPETFEKIYGKIWD